MIHHNVGTCACRRVRSTREDCARRFKAESGAQTRIEALAERENPLLVGFRSRGVGLSDALLLAQVNAPLNVFPAEHPLGFQQIVALAA